MNLKFLSKMELDHRLKALAQQERDLLHEVLLTLKEIDSRRTYLELGFGSLFDYLVKGVGYSEGSAQRRIDAARMIREVPILAEKIQSGELKLNQVSLVQKASREILRTQSVKVTPEQKLQVIEELCGKTHAESQQQVAAFFDLPILQQAHQRIQADESVRVEMTMSKEAFAKVQRAQELLSHAVNTKDVAAFLEYLSDKVIKQKTGSIEKTASVAGKENVGRSAFDSAVKVKNGFTATMAVKAVSQSSRKSCLQRPALKDVKNLKAQQRCCQYVDSRSGRRCESTWQLQVDHKQALWAQGNQRSENLQILCAVHNKMKYRKEAGIRYLS